MTYFDFIPEAAPPFSMLQCMSPDVAHFLRLQEH